MTKKVKYFRLHSRLEQFMGHKTPSVIIRDEDMTRLIRKKIYTSQDLKDKYNIESFYIEERVRFPVLETLAVLLTASIVCSFIYFL